MTGTEAIEFAKAHACGNDFLIVDAGQVEGRDLGSSRASYARARPALARMAWNT